MDGSSVAGKSGGRAFYIQITIFATYQANLILAFDLPRLFQPVITEAVILARASIRLRSQFAFKHSSRKPILEIGLSQTR